MTVLLARGQQAVGPGWSAARPCTTAGGRGPLIDRLPPRCSTACRALLVTGADRLWSRCTSGRPPSRATVTARQGGRQGAPTTGTGEVVLAPVQPAATAGSDV